MESYSKFKISHLSYKISPSYQTNNLTASSEYIAYVNNLSNQICTISQMKLGDDITKLEEYYIKSDDDNEVIDLRYVYCKGVWRLVLAFLNGCKIWSEDGKRMVAYIKIPDNHPKFYKDNDIQNYFKGITAVKAKNGKEAICVGNSIGEVHFLENTKENYFTNFVGLTLKNESCISCLATAQNYPLLLVGDILGNVHFYALDGLKENKLVKTIDINNKNNPITTLHIMERNDKSLLITGDAIGKIKIFDLLNYESLVEINAHFRSIMCMDIINDKGFIASGSEDSYVRLWSIDVQKSSGIKVEEIYNQYWNDKMIIGCKFARKDTDIHLMLSHYDSNELTTILKLK